MSGQPYLLAVIFTMLIFIGSAIVAVNWERIERRDAEQAQKCNDSGRVMRRIDGLLQCVAPQELAK